MKKAGAKEAHARKVADKIAGKVKEGTKTVEIWQWVIAELGIKADSKEADTCRSVQSLVKNRNAYRYFMKHSYAARSGSALQTSSLCLPCFVHTSKW
jgi:hypothetical protein